MDRRSFTKTLILSSGAVMLNLNQRHGSKLDTKENAKVILQETKKTFWTNSCSGATFHYLNGIYGFPKDTEERAVSPLSGGLLQTGHQCGMLWGGAMAIGAEAFRRYNDPNQAIAVAVLASQRLVESFTKTAKSVKCQDITKCDWAKRGYVKYFLTGRFIKCLNLLEKWAPEEMKTANEGLSQCQTNFQQPISCASEVAKRMGASVEETIMVAGFAGGIGLSGNGCGALGAALWMKTLSWCKENPKKAGTDYITGFYPNGKEILNKFYNITDSNILCSKICGQKNTTLEAHSEYIKKGGCDNLLNLLAKI